MRCVPYWPRATTRLSALLLAALLAGGASACASTAAIVPATPTPTSMPTLLPGSAGRIAPAAQMTVQRASHTATRLQDGKVLVVGGFKADGIFLASAELYDPATHTFVETGRTAAPHTSHTATLLPNGKVLVAGGSYGQPQQTAELYDPATGRFSPVTGMPPELRDGFSATLLTTGKVLLAGGYSTHSGYAARGDILASAELYDPTTNTIHPAGRMTTPRAGHTATLLADGRVLFAGGYTSQGVTASAEIYDPATGAFAPTGQMAVKRHKHAAVRLEERARADRGRVGRTRLRGALRQHGTLRSGERRVHGDRLDGGCALQDRRRGRPARGWRGADRRRWRASGGIRPYRPGHAPRRRAHRRRAFLRDGHPPRRWPGPHRGRVRWRGQDDRTGLAVRLLTGGRPESASRLRPATSNQDLSKGGATIPHFVAPAR